jgi:hypothetical protein
MNDAREKLPEDSLAALTALVRILESPSAARGLFGKSPPRTRMARRRVKKSTAKRPAKAPPRS